MIESDFNLFFRGDKIDKMFNQIDYGLLLCFSENLLIRGNSNVPMRQSFADLPLQ